MTVIMYLWNPPINKHNFSSELCIKSRQALLTCDISSSTLEFIIYVFEQDSLVQTFESVQDNIMQPNAISNYLQELRKGERFLKEFFPLFDQEMNPESLSDQDYGEYICQLIMEMDRLGLKKRTTCLATKYLDFFLEANKTVPQQNMILVLITCLRVAAQINECSEISNQLTHQFAMQQCSGLYSYEEIINMEDSLKKILGFQYEATTPYDFEFILKIIPGLEYYTQAIKHCIDLALILPQARCLSSEQIFFGCLINICKTTILEDTQLETTIKGMTIKWQQSISFTQKIMNKIQEIQYEAIETETDVDSENEDPLVEEVPKIQFQQ